MIKELLAKLRKKSVKAYRSGWRNLAGQGVLSGSLNDYIISVPGTSSTEKKEDNRIEKLPVEVYKEIFTKIPSVDCTSLDKKITMVENRINVLKQVGVALGDEHEALGFLKARKKLLKNIDLFYWETTSDGLIEKLLKTYKLKMVDFSGWSRNVPMEAIDELEKFVKAYEKVRDDQVILKLIVDDGGKETRKDPILLAASPFGAWWYVLGAWDLEVSVVDDLIYKKK